MTKFEKLDILKTIVTAAPLTDEDLRAELTEFLDSQLASIAARAEKAAQKRAETDALKQAVFAALSAEYQSVDDLMAAFAEDESVTRGRVISRLTALVKDGAVERDEGKPEGASRKVSIYRIKSAE